MERPFHRSFGVNDFVRWNAEDSLVLSPKFQRRKVWPRKARAFLIDTIIRGLPVPKLYMRQNLDLKSSKTIHEVVDGQQRISAVLDFKKDELKLPKDHEEFPGRKFSALPVDVQKEFLKYEFSVDLLIDASDADVLDIFARINSHSVPLNAQEKRNAKFFGSFKRTVYELGFEHLEFWKSNRILSDAAVARMREAELTSELLIAMFVGLQDKKKSLDSFYKKWDDRFPYRRKGIDRFRDLIDLLGKHIAEALEGSHFRRPVLFYSLFLAMYEYRYGPLGRIRGARNVFGTKSAAKFLAAIEKLDGVLQEKDPPAGYAHFVAACQRQTDNIGPRRTRHKMILDEVRKA